MLNERQKIPSPIIGVTAPIIADAYTHSKLNALFLRAGFPEDPPSGNKVEKSLTWLRRANDECAEPLVCFGRLIADFMDKPPPSARFEPWMDGEEEHDQAWSAPRDQIRDALAEAGLSYQRGGLILGASLSGPSRSLQEQLAEGGLKVLEREFERAYENIERDPAAALTAGCAILETTCKAYLESVGQPLPNKQTLKPLWNAAAEHLGLNPKLIADNDLKRVLSGMISVADGVASLRTHESSAHGRLPTPTYELEPRHARLAVHAAHTLAYFVIETWQQQHE